MTENSTVANQSLEELHHIHMWIKGGTVLAFFCFITLMIFGITIRGPLARLDQLTRFNRDVVEAVCDLAQDPTNRTRAQLQRLEMICRRMRSDADADSVLGGQKR